MIQALLLTIHIIVFCGAFADEHPPSLKQNDQQFIDFINSLDPIVNEALVKFNVPGAAVGVVLDGKILLSKGYGHRNLVDGLPVTENTLFTIASCSKAFTSLIMGQLMDEKKIALDDPVIQYIPEFRLQNSAITSQVTIRDLLAHRTGLARHEAVWFYCDLTREEILHKIPYLEHACGLREAFHYSNLLYTVAGIIIERVTGQSWEEAVSSRIFSPLGMTGSNATFDEMLASPDHSIPYVEAFGTLCPVTHHNLKAINPGGGINTNVVDLLKWVRLHLSYGDCRHLISDEALREMHIIQMPIQSKQDKEIITSGYGLGWFLGLYRDIPLIRHSGDTDGFTTEISMLPEKKIGVVVLTNSSTDGKYAASTISNSILDRFLGRNDIDWVKMTSNNRNSVKKYLNGLDNEERNRPSTIPPRPLTDYTGIYHHPGYGTIAVRIEDDQIEAYFGNIAIHLKHKEDDIFSGELHGLRYYGVNPYIDISFFFNCDGDHDEIHVPFEAFRSSKPVVFKRSHQ